MRAERTRPAVGRRLRRALLVVALTVLPMLIVFVVAQPQFVEGLAHSGLK
jgi:multiple sugar transport system permease protein